MDNWNDGSSLNCLNAQSWSGWDEQDIFYICQVLTLFVTDVDISDMLPEVEDVPDEIVEVYKQSEVGH